MPNPISQIDQIATKPYCLKPMPISDGVTKRYP
jgi:hypothetical protein